MQGFITTPIAKAVLTAENVDYVTSKSALGSSTVSVQHACSNSDPGQGAGRRARQGAAGARTAADRCRRSDRGRRAPARTSRSCTSRCAPPTMNPQQVTEFLTQVVQPRFATIDGVGEAQILGGRDFAMRVWLDPDPACGAQRHGERRARRDPRLQLPLRPRQDRERVRRLRHPDGRRRCRRRNPSPTSRSRRRATISCASATSRPIEYGAEKHRRARLVQRPGGHVPRRLRDARRECAQHLRGAQGGAAEIQRDLPPGMTIELVYDATRNISASIKRGVQDDRRSRRHRRPDHPRLPRLVPLGAGADRHDPAVADRRLLHPLCDRLLDQSPDAARHGARDRPCRRRRHRRGGEHPPAPRARRAAAQCGDRRHARDLLRGRRHDHHACRRLCADRLHARADRRALPRIRRDACRRRGDFRLRRGHPFADDRGARAEAARGRHEPLPGASSTAASTRSAPGTDGASPRRSAIGRSR